ncbi:MAG: DUF2232 domain-containing protein [Tissierellia bacterium]|nr:DUF2232 domain-containing protein [Tissierellia bacterium]
MKEFRLRKIIDILFMSVITALLFLIGRVSVLSYALIPSIMIYYAFIRKKIEYLLFLFLIFILIFSIDELNITIKIIGISLLITMIFAILIRTKLNDNKALIIASIILSIISIILYFKFFMNEINIEEQMSVNIENFTYEMTINNELVDFTKEDIIRILKMAIPSVLILLSFLFSLFTLKISKNAISTKLNGYKDFRKLEDIYLHKNTFIYFILILITIFLVLNEIDYHADLFGINAILIIYYALVLNGFSFYLYWSKHSKTNFIRMMFLILILVYLTDITIVFLLMGIFDLFYDYRKRSIE